MGTAAQREVGQHQAQQERGETGRATYCSHHLKDTLRRVWRQ